LDKQRRKTKKKNNIKKSNIKLKSYFACAILMAHKQKFIPLWRHMKKIVSILIVVILNLALSSINIQAQSTTTGTQSQQSTSNIKGLKELKKIEARNKKETSRERAAERKAQRKAEKRERDAEKKAQSKTKEKTKLASKSKSSKSTKSSNNIKVTSEKGSPRPNIDPVDLTSHKKIVNGHEVTVVEIEPKKK
jgi:hypothetical protein